ncbi:MAG: hypothetical protein KBD15_02145 [Candidatus Magasanikbacteria bacterium]|nr:hypothetical protein [Candidatus Magasanikbacteria bacterium]
MKHVTFFLLALPLVCVTLGAGCRVPNTTTQQTGAYNNFSSTSDNSTKNILSVTATIEQGFVGTNTPQGDVTTSTVVYDEAFALYEKNGDYFQFSNCIGNPQTFTIKNGTTFMIDNKDNVAHTIDIGTNTYQLDAYDFALVTLTQAGSYNVMCDGSGEAHVEVTH